jgi:hypothetical protein
MGERSPVGVITRLIQTERITGLSDPFHGHAGAWETKPRPKVQRYGRRSLRNPVTTLRSVVPNFFSGPHTVGIMSHPTSSEVTGDDVLSGTRRVRLPTQITSLMVRSRSRETNCCPAPIRSPPMPGCTTTTSSESPTLLSRQHRQTIGRITLAARMI